MNNDYECGNCGHLFSHDLERCPACKSEDIIFDPDALDEDLAEGEE